MITMKELWESNLVIALIDNKFKIYKNREGILINDVGLVGLLEILIDYYPQYRLLLEKLSNKIKIYRPFD